MQEQQQEEANNSDQPPIVSGGGPLIEPSLGSNSINDEDTVSRNPGLVSSYISVS